MSTQATLFKVYAEIIRAIWPAIDTRLMELVAEAIPGLEWRGHGVTWEFDEENKIARGTCTKCNAWVDCRLEPAPNQIDIGGSACGLNCKE
jgi:hypothetical protein